MLNQDKMFLAGISGIVFGIAIYFSLKSPLILAYNIIFFGIAGFCLLIAKLPKNPESKVEETLTKEE